jgi:hypothetical protein
MRAWRVAVNEASRIVKADVSIPGFIAVTSGDLARQVIALLKRFDSWGQKLQL